MRVCPVGMDIVEIVEAIDIVTRSPGDTAAERRRRRQQEHLPPLLATIDEVIDETPDVRTLRLVFQDEAVRDSFTFRAGQFGEYSAFGAGESTFCIASSPTREGLHRVLLPLGRAG